jgi:phosphate/sulfate permease
MNWEGAGTMVAISVAISTLMGFVFSLMIRSAIAEATSKLTAELHALVSNTYVRKDVYERDLKETRRGIRWIAQSDEGEED